MGILDGLLGRLGYVKLDEYGLVRSPEARIVMLHRRILDDGTGGRIVGWRAEDPAPTLLEPMDVVPRSAARAVEAARSSLVAAAGVAPAMTAPLASPRPTVVRASSPRAAGQARGTSVGGPRAVTRQPTQGGVTEDEEEWEWQLAMARARAAADETERAAASIKELPVLVEVSRGAPVVGVATLTPSPRPSTTTPAVARAAAPPPAVARAAAPSVPAPLSRPVPGMVTSSTAPLAVSTLAPSPGPVPIERARIARGSAALAPSARVMSPPRPPRVPDRLAEARAERDERAAQIAAAADARPLPLPAPEDTRTKLKPAPPRTPKAPKAPLRPAAIAAAARANAAARPVPQRFESEITRTDGRPPLPRFSARFR